LTCPSPPACCCVPRPLPPTRKSCSPSTSSPSAPTRTLRRNLPLLKRPRSSVTPERTDTGSPPRTLTRVPYLGGDIRSNFLLNLGRLSTSRELERNTNAGSERRTLPINHDDRNRRAPSQVPPNLEKKLTRTQLDSQWVEVRENDPCLAEAIPNS